MGMHVGARFTFWYAEAVGTLAFQSLIDLPIPQQGPTQFQQQSPQGRDQRTAFQSLREALRGFSRGTAQSHPRTNPSNLSERHYAVSARGVSQPGINMGSFQSLREALRGFSMGVSRERVRQINFQSLREALRGFSPQTRHGPRLRPYFQSLREALRGFSGWPPECNFPSVTSVRPLAGGLPEHRLGCDLRHFRVHRRHTGQLPRR